MSRTAHKLMASSGSKGYEIDQSLMLDKASGSYLNRTPSSASNRRTWTYSVWLKKSTSSDSAYVIFSAHDNTNENDAGYGWIGIYGAKLYVGGGSTNWRITNRKFRDVSAWYHIVVAVDTTQGTAGNRVKVYLNGEEITSFDTSNNPSQNLDLAFNSTVDHQIGAINYSNRNYWDGYMAEINFIDGSQLTASSFGETDSATGQWIPKEYTGSHGTNGFYKPFKKNDRYCVYFDGSTSTGITTPDHTDFTLGTNNFTIEAWVYRDEDAGNTGYICGNSQADGANASAGVPALYIDTNNKPHAIIFATNGASYFELISSTAINDNEWNHVALVRNSNTFSLYLNGTSVASNTTAHTMADSSNKMGVGVLGEYTANHFKGWISNFRLVNGTAVYTSNFTPSTSPLTAITNTKLLCCQDSTVTTENSGTSKTLTVTAANTYSQQMSPFTYDWYQDQSGQDNHYKADNVTVNDVMLDSPTNNFPIYNLLDSGSNITLSQGNLKTTFSGWSDVRSTFQLPFTGKWYWELANTTDGNGYFGLWTTNYTDTDAGQDYGTGKQATSPGNLSGVSGYFSSAWSSGDIIAMAVDCDNGKLWWSKNGTWGSSGNPATGANQGLTFTATDKWSIILAGASGFVTNINFGQNGTFSGTKLAQGNADGEGIGNFYYAPPSGFKALCTKNLPNLAVKKSSNHFNSVIYTGTGSTRSVTGVGHKPGILWIKAYSTTDDHRVQDEVRGSTKQLDINNTDAEYTAADGITSFDSDGFTIGADSSNQFNVSGTSSVAFSWKGAGSGSANNSGDINATVSANTTAGISIIKWTANGSNADTIAHGLGVKPSVVWYKKIDNGGHSWYVLTDAIDGSNDYLAMNTAGGVTASSGSNGWATSSTISNWTWNDGHGMMAYAFAEVEGFSQFGVYNGNAVVNGPFIHTGFTPKFFMAKHIGTNGEWWYQYDTARDEDNPIPAMLFPNANSAQYTSGSNVIDIVSNGIKLRANNGTINGYSNNSNATYFYMAFAEFPLKYANAR